MNAISKWNWKLACVGRFYVLLAVAFSCVLHSFAADADPQVVLNTAKAAPRSVESLTQRSILRDYKFAWVSLERALEGNSVTSLNGPFDGTSRRWLSEAVANQKNSGIKCRYLNQTHKVEAVFYAPEGDVMELHDTAEYDLQVLDGSKTIHSEHAIVHYIVLMTPGADRWFVRQLQAVPQF